MDSIHLIHIGERAERLRAIEAIISVPEACVSLPGHILGISGKHLEALMNATPPIKYETARKAHLPATANKTL